MPRATSSLALNASRDAASTTSLGNLFQCLTSLSGKKIPPQIQPKPPLSPLKTAPLLPSAAWQQNVMEYWQEGSTPISIPTFTSDVMGQHNKTEGIIHSEGGEALEQVAQGGCGCPIPGGIQDQAGCGSEQPILVVHNPTHSRVVETRCSLWSFSTQAIL